ncbi:Crp/Fnr family transcriptional regulator [Alkalicoccus saliphilus]|uniref:Crp/Fnr family transcriptional regulator n=1 Tax=Alkalicoccus saliphilus TaxID=200989 RepID=A0A2T4U218_9BACI|nr:Crp/Fnr family transcriptional regulator [Alkalicoccus saliphilus]PTL37443.1 Crp/Fnr family transcriptional regulator [Alkalicoccus saliphilus]
MSSNDHLCGCHGSMQSCVSIVPIFNHLQPPQMETIMKAVRTRTFKKGESIYRAGDFSDTLYIVHKGKIKTYRLAESGKEYLVSVLHPGDFSGEYALFSESIHESYAETLEPSEICTIQRKDLQGILEKYPEVALKILGEFSRKLEQSEKQTAYFATERVESRIALYLADLQRQQGERLVKLPMSRKDLAAHLGTTPETVSRKLADLESGGYIRQHSPKKLEILDLDGLLA